MKTPNPKLSIRRQGLLVLAAVAVAICGALTPAAFADSVGKLVWVELITEDAATATSFYEKLLDWKIEEREKDRYTVFVGDKPIASISQIDDKLEEEEAQWLVGLEVENLSESLAAARRLGATIHIDASHKEGFAKYSIIEDPEGAPVVLLDPDQALGGERAAGNWVWAELWTDDMSTAGKFYSEVVGYERSETDVAGQPYPLFEIDGEPRAGIYEIENKAVDPIWAPYLAVEDVAATAKKAKSLGGRVLLEPNPDIRGGRVALLADPSGGAFFIYQIEAGS
jgi:predicted enzyme related to lactoylglutathione lyase